MSTRRFIAEALLEVLTDAPFADRGTVASEGAALAAVVEQMAPAWLLIDLDRPGIAFEEVAARVTEADGLRKIAFYDTFTARHAETAFALGVTMLFPLTSDAAHVVDAVFGERASAATAAEGVTRDELARLGTLTAREIEVLQHLAAGRPVKVIARLLGITPHTVETHKRRVFRKLGVQQQAQAVAMAIAGGAVAPAAGH